MTNLSVEEKKFKKINIALSIIIPLAVALLFKVKFEGDFTYLPPIYATINGLTAIVLIIAVAFIKNGDMILHKRLIHLALIMSCAFLIMYILYHATSDATTFGGEGMIKYVYYFILISHIVLSIAVIPLVLNTYFRAKVGNYEAHKKISKITFFIWEYVAITGVIVYWMIKPYY